MSRLGLAKSPFRNLIPREEGAVCSYCPVASAVGTRVLHDGGNAVDAAVATGLALAATYPQAGNVAGGGYMLVKSPGRECEMIDFRETAPGGIHPDMFERKGNSVQGGLAVATPGTVAGFAAALERYGTVAWDRLVRPTIELAELGSWVTTRQAKYFGLYDEQLRTFDETAQSLLPERSPWRPGDLFRIPDLGKTLRLLGDEGPEAFYRGSIADQIVSTVTKYGGVLTHDDLANYRPVWRKPYVRKVFNREVITASLPSGGGIVVSVALGLLEAAGIAAFPVRSPERYAMLGRAFRIAYKLRMDVAGDPDFLDRDTRVKCEELIETRFRSDSIDVLEKELGLDQGQGPKEPFPDRNTTHFVAIDKDGMVASSTYSLNTLFGSKLVAEGTGLLLNNTIDDFGISPDVPNWYQLFEGTNNTLAPYRRPVGSMAPTLVMKGDEVHLALGASGGPRIPTAIVQIVLGMLGNNMGLGQAMELARVHHQHLPDQLDVEDSLDSGQVQSLENMGFDVVRFPRLAIASAIGCDRESNGLLPILDPRF